MPIVVWGALAAVAYGVWRYLSARQAPGPSEGEEGAEEGDEEASPGATDVDPTYDFAQIDTYPPHSPEAVALFQAATAVAGLPVEWASWPSLHNILGKESRGRVGIPNYTYLPRSADPANWPVVWAELRAGRYTGNRIVSGPEAGKYSSATGLGQLTLPNVRRFYPSGVQGIGVALEEAVGMLRYIEERYGDPDAAWAQYGKHGEGY